MSVEERLDDVAPVLEERASNPRGTAALFANLIGWGRELRQRFEAALQQTRDQTAAGLALLRGRIGAAEAAIVACTAAQTASAAILAGKAEQAALDELVAALDDLAARFDAFGVRLDDLERRVALLEVPPIS